MLRERGLNGRRLFLGAAVITACLALAGCESGES